MRSGQRGFNIIELMLVVAIIGVLLSLGLPSFQSWMQNMRIRAAAEGLLSGMQVARSEAIRRNVAVQLRLNNGTGWKINLASDPDGVPLRERAPEEGGGQDLLVTALPGGADTITFNGLGRVATNQDASAAISTLSVDNPNFALVTEKRIMQVVIPTGGGARMCDPQVLVGDPRAC